MLRARVFTIALVAIVSAAIALATRAVPAAEQDTGGSSGTARLSSGVQIQYQCFFDRNALKDARSINGRVFALTTSGGILVLDESTLGVRNEWFDRPFVTCLGQTSDGSLLAGFEDGRVCVIDATTLKSKERAARSGPTAMGGGNPRRYPWATAKQRHCGV